jgi:RNA polymerase sigma-70 factor (ECF subfamily)
VNSAEQSCRFHSVAWPQLATVLRVAQILTGNAADAEDLAQETMLRAFKSMHSFAEGSDIKAWLMTILRHARIDRLRSTARERQNISLDAAGVDPSEPEHPSPSDADSVWENPEEVLNAFADQQVIDALKTLPEDIRMTLLLVDVEQLDHQEAAKILDVPVGTIKSRTHRGRAMLRTALLPMAKDLRMTKD